MFVLLALVTGRHFALRDEPTGPALMLRIEGQLDLPCPDEYLAILHERGWLDLAGDGVDTVATVTEQGRYQVERWMKQFTKKRGFRLTGITGTRG